MSRGRFFYSHLGVVRRSANALAFSALDTEVVSYPAKLVVRKLPCNLRVRENAPLNSSVGPTWLVSR